MASITVRALAVINGGVGTVAPDLRPHIKYVHNFVHELMLPCRDRLPRCRSNVCPCHFRHGIDSVMVRQPAVSSPSQEGMRVRPVVGLRDRYVVEIRAENSVTERRQEYVGGRMREGEVMSCHYRLFLPSGQLPASFYSFYAEI